MTAAAPVLVGDIGGTNVRLALAFPDGRLEGVWRGRCADFAGPEDAAAAYLRETGARPGRAVLAAAGPVRGGAVTLTNNGWRLDGATLDGVGLLSTRIINDFAALALAIDLIGEPGLQPIGPAAGPAAGAPVAVVGPGTGFGVAAAVPAPGGRAAVTSEGGHVAFAPLGDLEREIQRRFAARYGRVSVERLLCGQGLADLHVVLGEIEGQARAPRWEGEVAAAALEGEPAARRTVEVFLDILASAAGDVGLMFAAEGGVFIGGGVALRLAPLLDAARFRARFEDKGRLSGFLRAAPTALILDPCAALRGAARAA